ncbi:MAG: DNA replication complex GINS family protein [Methanomicrobium sp.]|nr:DNA replication complex GINS family protein [Methanomicrobium sp.]
MDFDYLRLISLDERDNGKLTPISSDTFDMAREYIAELCEEAKSGDNFMTKRGTELIEEIESVQSVLQSIIDLRVKKIIQLAEDLSKTGRSDKEQIKRMTPAEKQMYDEILAAISRCRDALNAAIPAGRTAGAADTERTSPQETQSAYAPASSASGNVQSTAANAQYSANASNASNASDSAVSSAAESTTENTGAATSANTPAAAYAATVPTPANTATGAQVPTGGSAAYAGDRGADNAGASEGANFADPLDGEDADVWDDADFRDFAAQGTQGAGASRTGNGASSGGASAAATSPATPAGTSVTAEATNDTSATGAESTPIEYELLCVKRDIDSFMGIDNKIYTISAGDILMLPADNARVLRDRNIALNIKVSK